MTGIFFVLDDLQLDLLSWKLAPDLQNIDVNCDFLDAFLPLGKKPAITNKQTNTDWQMDGGMSKIMKHK